MSGIKFVALVCAALFLGACQDSVPTEAPATSVLETSPSSMFSPSVSATPEATETEIPASEVTIELPPSGALISRVDSVEQNLVALTIDDGYGKIPFDAILNELRERDIQATFFLVGLASINLGQERMQQLVADGHHIAYHSYGHNDLDELRRWKESDWLADYEIWQAAMLDLLGQKNFDLAYRPFARAPYGLFNLAFLAMTEELDLIPVGWSNDPGDLERGIKLRAGDIFLLHVRYPDADLMGPIFDEQDFEFVTLDELIAAQEEN